MHRVPNPPKVPLPFATETKSRGVASGSASTRARAIVATLVLIATAALNASPLPGGESRPQADADRAAAATSLPNFVVRGTSPARGRLIRDHAESLRRTAFADLLGEAEPRPWLTPCEIHVHASADSFTAAVGGPPAEARGATSLEFAGDRVTLRRIDVMGDGASVVPDALDHELVHVVLADHFVHVAPPRWADEGLALLFDSPEKQRRHDADFQDARGRGLAWTASELVTMDEYPADAARTRVFYGQSAALVRWMIARHDAATFIRFLDDIPAIGIDAALDRHYAVGSLDSVSSAWKEVAPINSLGLTERRR